MKEAYDTLNVRNGEIEELKRSLENERGISMQYSDKIGRLNSQNHELRQTLAKELRERDLRKVAFELCETELKDVKFKLKEVSEAAVV